MEDPASGIDELLLAQLKALSARGSSLCRTVDGSGLVQRKGRSKPVSRITPAQFLTAIARGFVSHAGEGRYILSKRGADVLRIALSRPQGAPATARAPQPRYVAKPRAAVAESPLAWLRQRRDRDGKPLIDKDQFEAGERLRRDFTLAHMMPRITQSWNPALANSRPSRGTPSAGLELTERALASRQRVEAALRAVGPELSGVLIDVCCFLKGLEEAETAEGWPRRSGKLVLQLALTRLARHYGLETSTVSRQRTRILHWAADDYRPAMDAAEDQLTNVPTGGPDVP